MYERYLLVLDFDQTCFDTFQENPKGIGVHKAYELAIKEIFGDVGLKVFKDAGGLKNGAPEEIVDMILDDSSVSLFKNAEDCFDARNKTLKRLVPQGKGAPLEWISYNENLLRKTISELLVLIKMSLLYDEVGSKFPDGEKWPQPCLGFLEFFHAIEELRKGGIDIQIAILSSNHEKFIRKTFSIWDLSPPDIIVSDDDMRGRAYPETVDRRVKPSSFLFDLVHERWIGRGVLFSEYARHIELNMESRKRMMYFGDDLNKDGGLAENAGVLFGLFDSDQKEGILNNSEELFLFKDWSEELFIFKDWRRMANFFLEGRTVYYLKQGMEIKELFYKLF